MRGRNFARCKPPASLTYVVDSSGITRFDGNSWLHALLRVYVFAFMSLVVILVVGGSVAKASDCSHRKSELRLISEGFSAADVATQLDTLDKAMKTKCPVVRHIALSQAFASSEETLRSAALIATIASSSTLLVQVFPGAKPNGDEEKWVSDNSHGRFVLDLGRYDHDSDSVAVYTDSSQRRYNMITTYPGNIVGDRFSFNAPVPGLNGYLYCSAVTYLQRDSPSLQGDLICGGSSAKVKIDLLK